NAVSFSQESSCTYDGTEQKPEVQVVVGNTTLTKDTDYTVSYRNNLHATSQGSLAIASVEGKGNYTGTVEMSFTIAKRTLQVKADDIEKAEGSDDPQLTYAVSGQVQGENPAFTGSLEREAGEANNTAYTISQGTLSLTDRAADAGGKGAFRAADYQINFTEGTFTILEIVWREVTFTDPTAEAGSTLGTDRIRDGETVDKPQDPTRAGFTFDGWYISQNGQEVSYDFASPVRSDLTLIARWACAHPEDQIEYQNKSDATCAMTGYTGDKYCRQCGRLIEQGSVIPKSTEHTYVLMSSEADPQAIYQYINHYTCTTCGAEMTENGPQIYADPAVDPAVDPALDPVVNPVFDPTGPSGTDPAVTDPSYGGGGDDDDDDEDDDEDEIDDATERALNKAGFEYEGDGEVSYTGPQDPDVKSVKVPANVEVNDRTFAVTVIGEGAFADCMDLTSVTLGSNVIEIRKNAFKNCKSLTKITIPKKVESIGKQAFMGCSNLKKITIKTKLLTKKKVGSKAFKGIHKKAVFKVPSKVKKLYKSFLKKKGVTRTMKIK
nr:leucine-rich repeat protein [Lachnospiraceae bacterium]